MIFDHWHWKNIISKKLHLLFVLVFTFMLDFVGLFMVVSIFAPLLLDPETLMLPSSASHFIRTFTIGLLVASYGIGQFFGGPILGELSDQFGRKKILCIGLSILIIGNLLGALGLVVHSLVLLFICRFLTGIASGNASVIFAAVSLMSKDDREKSINLGYLAGAASIGVVIGPFFAAHLSNPNLVNWFSWYTPFLVMALLVLVNLILVLVTYEDKGIYRRRELHFTVGFRNIAECLTTPCLRVILLAYFLFVTSTETLFAGLPIYAVQKFNVSSIWLGNLFAWGSLLAAFSSLYLNKKLNKKLNFYWITFGALILLCLGYGTLFIPNTAWGIYLPYSLVGLACSVVWGNENAIIASNVSADVQGKVLGVAQSLLSLALIIGPSVMGLVASYHYNLIILLSLVAGVLALITFSYFWRVCQNKLHSREVSEGGVKT